MCEVCQMVGGYCGNCDGTYWSEFNAQAEIRRQAALRRARLAQRQARALYVAQRHLQFAYLRWANFSCSLLPASEPVYQDRCASCGGHGCATCNYWETTR